MTRLDDRFAFISKYENCAWYEDGKVRILDRRIYPIKIQYVECQTHEDVAQAIADMVTQSGGPYQAAAMGMALAAYEAKERNFRENELLAFMEKAAYTLSHACPTTVAGMERVTNKSLEIAKKLIVEGRTGQDLIDAMFNRAIEKYNEDFTLAYKISRFMAPLIPENGTIMTQCYAGEMIVPAVLEHLDRGSKLKIICPETRPYFQGARLNASMFYDLGCDVTVITDNMPAYTMKAKNVDVFISAADVVSMDGYAVNKVGTFQISLAAQYWGIPHYVTSWPNRKHPTIETVDIELRDPMDAMSSMGLKLTKDGVKGFYPAFDIAPPKLINAYVTDRGVFSPYDLKSYYEKNQSRSALRSSKSTGIPNLGCRWKILRFDRTNPINVCWGVLSKLRRMSSISSSPADSCLKSRITPALICSSSLSSEWVVVVGWFDRLFEPH